MSTVDIFLRKNYVHQHWCLLETVEMNCNYDRKTIPESLNEIMIKYGNNWNDKFEVHDSKIRYNHLTPYQEDFKRMWGEFSCSDQECKIEWSSAYSYKDTFQECKTCGSKTYPFIQRPLFRPRFPAKKNKNHIVALCGMCRRLGRSCVNAKSSSNDLSDIYRGIENL